MKYLSIFVILLACQLGLNAQSIKESSVPQVVRTNFIKVVPNTSVSDWKMADSNYEAQYKQNDVVNSVILSQDGAVVRYENTITSNELPEAVRSYITTNFAGKKMGKMIRVKTVTGSVSYKIEADGSYYFLDGDGKVVDAQN